MTTKQIFPWRVRDNGGHRARGTWTRHAYGAGGDARCGIPLGGVGVQEADADGRTLQGEKLICRRCFPPSASEFTVVLADWKDTEELIDQLREALKMNGVILQQWDVGTDDWVLTVARRRVTAAEMVTEMSPDVEPGEPVTVEEVTR